MLGVFAVVVFLVTIFILTAVNRIADHANNLDEQRSRATTVGALRTFQQQLQATLNDYAAWDDAATYVYAPDGKDWIVSNFGDMTVNSDLFDVAILLDAKRNVLMAYQDGHPVDWTPDNYFDSSLWTLFDDARSAGPEREPESAGFTATSDGITATGVALVRQKSGSIDQPPDKRRYLVFARHLDGKKVAALGQTYVIGGLHFVSNGEYLPNAVDIVNVHGKRLAQLGWMPRMPGDVSYLQVRPLVYSAVAMVGLFFLLLLVTGTNALNRLRSDEAAARRLAMTDRLSGLLNRTGFFVSLDGLVDEAKRSQQSVVLLYLDLDGFKEVNDAYGHGTGDTLIRSVAAGLKMLVSDDAILARVGGDEFAIAMPSAEPDDMATVLCERVLGFLAEPFVIGERVAVIGASIGIAISPQGAVDGAELVRRADMAMYRAKETGRRRFEHYVPGMDAEREERHQLEIDLRGAIEREELTVVYQPVMSAKDGRIAGVEALARWNRKGHGPVSPDIFIPIAETSGLIDQLGLFVLQCACETVKRWPGLRLSVNVSPGQFRDPAFPQHVKAVLRRTAADPAEITLEMTEGYFIQNAERAKTSMTELRRLGVHIALDDFGAGFSSIGYLRQFGFDRMKIDKSLVHALDQGQSAADLLQATVAMARALDIPVTAEGVETDAQALQLRLAGCDQLQGYLFGRPMTVDDMDGLYQRGERRAIFALT
ncbi:EAL domain-containing protein [Neorhizobium sp. NCHU2750]|uniref:bifunctional diguanylate cyclase/phosphodiesterase n=1 Tax=Neorhizobium sp. NCHU2750 TaxID=1825976 RepID=UPI001FE0AF22